MVVDSDDSSLPTSMNSAMPSPSIPPPPESPPPIFAVSEENPVPQSEADHSNYDGRVVVLPPQSFQLPPGLEPPPGLEQSRDGLPIDCMLASQTPPGLQPQMLFKPQEVSLVAIGSTDNGTSQSVSISKGNEEDKFLRAEWRMNEVKKNLTRKLDKALVSPCFALGENSDFMLMVQVSLPTAQVDGAGDHGKKKQANVKNMLKEGNSRIPLRCNLSLKASATSDEEKQFYLTVGERHSSREQQRRGPFVWNFAKQSKYTCDDFDFDWFHHIHEDRLLVGVEFVP